jgi:hypothetical protein
VSVYIFLPGDIMTVIKRETVKDLYYVHVLSEIHKVEDKISLFSAKYGLPFEKFETAVQSREVEHFESWDDYMEWKACEKSLQDLLIQKKDIQNDNYQIA